LTFDTVARQLLLALLFLLVLTSWIPGPSCTFIFDAAVFALLAAWALYRCARPAPVARSILLPPLAAIVLWGFAQLAAGRTVYPYQTWTALLDWSALLALFFLSLQLYGSPSARAGLRRAMLSFGFALGVISVAQLFSSGGKVFWLFQTQYAEFVAGPFLNRDHYCAFIELLLPLAAVQAFWSRRHKIAYAAIAGAMLATIVASATRAGTIVGTLEVAVISLAALWGRAHAGIIRSPGARTASFLRLTALAAVFIAVVGWEVVWQRFQDPDPFKFRREMDISSLQMVRDRPWIGFGLGTFESAYPAYALFDSGLTVNHAHNDWLEWAADGGIPLFLLMVFIALWSARAAWRSPWALGILAVFLHAAVDFPLHKPAISACLFVLLGALAAKNARRAPALPATTPVS
jgi:O-antigen ligase